MDINKAVGQRIRDRRSRLNLTQQELADMIGMNRNTFAQLEGGINELRVSTLISLAEALGVSVGYLTGEIGDREVAELAALAGYNELSARDKSIVVSLINLMSSETPS